MIGAVPVEQPEPALVPVHLARDAAPGHSGFNEAIGHEFFSGDPDEADNASSFRTPSPADSHYALPDGLDGDDHLDDWAADDFSASSFDRDQSARHPDAAHTWAEPWYYRAIYSWGRAQFYGVIAFAALSMAILGGLVVGRLTGHLTPQSSTIVIVVAVVAAIALLMVSLLTAALNLLLLDLLRNIYRHQASSDSQSKAVR